MRATVGILLSAAVLALSLAAAQRPVPNPVLAERLEDERMDVYGLVHWGLNTYTDREWGYGDEDPKMFDPKKFDADKIVASAKAGGLGGIILVAKHHDGFCLWPTKTTDHNITKSPFRGGKGDVVKELEQACRRAGLRFGVYISPWDRHDAKYGTADYVERYHRQIRELLGGDYGEIFEMWFDGANGGDGWYGGAKEKRIIPKDYYRFDEIFRFVRELQPKVCIFNERDDADFRWPGNEEGILEANCRATAPSFNSENYAPYYTWAADGTHEGAVFHPPEADFPLRRGWFYHRQSDGKSRTGEYLMKSYLRTVGNGGTMNLGLSPNKDGELTDEDIASLKRFGELRHAFFAKEVKDGEPFNVVVMREDISRGERIDAWELQADGKAVLMGRSIGIKRIRVLPRPVTAKSVTLNILAAANGEPPVTCRRYFVDPSLADKVLKSSFDGGETDTAKWMQGFSSDSGQPRKAALEKLPLGSVRPEGWLRTQLELQRDGLTGHAEELYEDIGESDWLTGGKKGGQYAWERGPYYAKGLVALALTLDDAALKAKAERWVTSILRSQRENGDFGPKEDNWWANMIALHLIRDWGAATDDKRVEPFLRRYFAYQSRRIREKPLASDSPWAVARAGDELEVVLWLYDRTHDASLVDLAEQLLWQGADWTTYYRRGGDGTYGPTGFRQHIVNFMQGLKLPALKWRVRGDAADRGAYRAAFGSDGWVMKMHGRVDRMVNGSEPLAGRSASEGTELCAIAERILSCQEVVAAIGDLTAADDLETVAYNTLPSALGDDGRGMRYYQLLNQPVCETKRDLGFVNNHEGTSYTPGPDAGYGCCRSNFHFAWPKFVQSMWMRKDGGLAAVAYGPSTLRTTVGGREVVVKTETDYPFGDTVTLKIVKGGGTFPIFTRIPGWDVAKDAGAFRKFERTWQAGDEIKLVFSPKVVAEKGIHDSIAVKRGALVYSLKIDAETTALAAPTNRTGFPVREIRPKTPWNYALVVPASGLPTSFVPAEDLSGNVFAHGRVPCALKVRGFRTTSGCWGSMHPWISARANEPPPSPIARTAEDGPDEELTLVPMGATQIRMTLFPWTTSL